ncbi:HEPN domain-containing protein [Mesobacillus subterraneus]|uniref:HEPN domain-containing protein n=1 Tax=Mesobacillus subterraneus TaxID=285983 RepID=UPI001CFD72C9|nr:HEPN domain-containing protein [Mesobacillus subterraneus]WLR54612.1 HEPN domain-containing protein [Mesobacillus subterraneus]
MNNQVVEKKIKDCFKEIQYVKRTLKRFKPLDKEREFFSKYILIYISGVLEISYKTLISDYCVEKSNVQLHNFFETIIVKKSKNATIDNICEILKNIDPEIKKSFKENLKKNRHYEEIKSSVESLNTLRHSFAHGILTEKVYFADIEKYYLQSVKMLIILDKTISTRPVLSQQ